MKLIGFLSVLMRSIETVDFAECPPIKPVPDEDGSGPICEFNYCIRNCKNGFKPMHPKKAICMKGKNEFFWASRRVPATLGGCIDKFKARNLTDDEAYLYRAYRIKPRGHFSTVKRTSLFGGEIQQRSSIFDSETSF